MKTPYTVMAYDMEDEVEEQRVSDDLGTLIGLRALCAKLEDAILADDDQEVILALMEIRAVAGARLRQLEKVRE